MEEGQDGQLQPFFALDPVLLLPSGGAVDLHVDVFQLPPKIPQPGNKQAKGNRHRQQNSRTHNDAGGCV